MSATMRPRIPPRLPGEPRPGRAHRMHGEAPDLSGWLGQVVEVRCSGGGLYRGDLRAVGPDWMAVDLRSGSRCLVRLASVTGVVLDTLATSARRDAE